MNYENAMAMTYIAQRMAEEMPIDDGSIGDDLLGRHITSVTPAHTVGNSFTGWDFPSAEVKYDNQMELRNEFVELLTEAIIAGAIPFRGGNIISISRRLVPGSSAPDGESAARVIAAAITGLPSFWNDALVMLTSRWLGRHGNVLPSTTVAFEQ